MSYGASQREGKTAAGILVIILQTHHGYRCMVPFYWRRQGVLQKLNDILRLIEGYVPTHLPLEYLAVPGPRNMAERLGVYRRAGWLHRPYLEEVMDNELKPATIHFPTSPAWS